ncbi:alpha/beta fold hydrolase [Streptomyces parvulus]|uniref:Alpha/beta fold hydrolase n=1 Tax=Streptomyces parvulus TaxID=146923 RepID=A0A369UV34_9ACTN|nr:alpha/beta fold hydrolase [Streptomyces parvulus]RDD84612.1 alpha/beta fold hydrolase [Streptomyces parvulus]
MPSARPGRTGVLPRGDVDVAYETTGVGPPLLVLASGYDDLPSSAALADLLRDDFTVLRYDRRGVGASPEEKAADAASRFRTHADDAAALVDAHGLGPVHAVGASYGALIGLELVARYPDRVLSALLHEPTLEYLVPDPERSAKLDEVARLATTDPLAAMRAFGEVVGSDDAREPDAPLPPQPHITERTIERFFATDFPAVRGYRVDDDALIRSADRVVLTNGVHSAGRFEARCSEALAARLALEHRTLPTGHSALRTFPRTMSEVLRERLLGQD